MTIWKKYALVLPVYVLSACIYVPVVDKQQAEASSCKTVTQSMSLEAIEAHGNINMPENCHNNKDCAALITGVAATAIVVTAGSAIISGSIVLTGNTVHWLEYQGTCSEGYLNKTKQLFLDSFSHFIPDLKQSSSK